MAEYTKYATHEEHVRLKSSKTPVVGGSPGIAIVFLKMCRLGLEYVIINVGNTRVLE